MRKLLLCVLPWLLLIIVVAFCFFVPRKDMIGPVELPADDAFLPSQDVQWWYWTGPLTATAAAGEEEHTFGFEIVFFTFDSFLVMRDQLIQAAITDVTDQSFHFKEYVELNRLPDRTANSFNLSAGSGKISAVGGSGKDHVHSEVDGYVLDLDLEAVGPPVRHYGAGPHPYVFHGYTYYYSRERMTAKGTLSVNGKEYTVEGLGWFDRQYGELFQAISKGWQWFAIQLDDHRQLMLFDFLGGEQSEIEKYGSLTDAEGNTTVLGPHQFEVEKLGEWKSPHTGCTYPSGWLISIGEKELELEVKPMVLDQELRANHDFWVGPEYWEGLAGVTGGATGTAYVELNGFCRSH